MRRHEETARACAAELGCDRSTDDYRRLAEWRPDAVLIEAPHKAQDEIALWALGAGYDLLMAAVWLPARRWDGGSWSWRPATIALWKWDTRGPGHGRQHVAMGCEP